MNWNVKLAKSLNESSQYNKHTYVQKFAQIAIALCMATVLISSFLIKGFESKIQEKVYTFWAQLRLESFATGSTPYSDVSTQLNEDELNKLRVLPEVKDVSVVSNKIAILKQKDNIEGIIIKGISDFDSKSHQLFTQAKNVSFDSAKYIPIVLSNYTLNRLNTKIGNPIYINIIDSQVHIVRGMVVNSYYSNIEEFDQKIAFSTLNATQTLNNWPKDKCSWVELYLKDPNQTLEMQNKVYHTVPDDYDVINIYQIFPQIFDWLELMKKNESIILIVMELVAIINIISSISIYILEKLQFYGMLKVLGATNKGLYQMTYFAISKSIFSGIFWGNIIAFLLAFIQWKWHIIKLDPTIYYIEYAPISIEWIKVLIFNVITILICFLAAWVPIRMISKISPVKVAEFR